MRSRRLGRRVVSYSQLCETLCPRGLSVDVFYTKFTTESQRNAEIAQRSFQIRTPPPAGASYWNTCCGMMTFTELLLARLDCRLSSAPWSKGADRAFVSPPERYKGFSCNWSRHLQTTKA